MGFLYLSVYISVFKVNPYVRVMLEVGADSGGDINKVGI